MTLTASRDILPFFGTEYSAVPCTSLSAEHVHVLSRKTSLTCRGSLNFFLGFSFRKTKKWEVRSETNVSQRIESDFYPGYPGRNQIISPNGYKIVFPERYFTTILSKFDFYPGYPGRNENVNRIVIKQRSRNILGDNSLSIWIRLVTRLDSDWFTRGVYQSGLSIRFCFKFFPEMIFLTSNCVWTTNIHQTNEHVSGSSGPITHSKPMKLLKKHVIPIHVIILSVKIWQFVRKYTFKIFGSMHRIMSARSRKQKWPHSHPRKHDPTRK